MCEENDEYLDDEDPCNNCDYPCDHWEAQFCCTRCHYIYGEADPPCEYCDPMDI